MSVDIHFSFIHNYILGGLCVYVIVFLFVGADVCVF